MRQPILHPRIFQDPIVSHKCMSKMAVKTSREDETADCSSTDVLRYMR